MSAPDLPAGGGLVIAERPRSLVSVLARKGRTEALAAALRQAFGLDLPGPGRFASVGVLSATWIQPDVWLLEDEPDAPDRSGAFCRRIAEAVSGLAAVVDQSHGRSVVRITGAEARAVLATCCRLDLHPRVFGPGAAAATLLAHVPGLVRALDRGGFDLLVGSTYARWLMEELVEASAASEARLVPAASPHRSAMPAAGALR